MTIYRSYFSKGNTIIQNNKSNNSQNPVTEISYGTLEDSISRFIFDIDLEPLIQKINNGEINRDLIQSHKLVLYNTISNYNQKSTKSYDSSIDRASSFSLDLFNIIEDWDEGSGYDLNYIDTISDNPVNWYDRKTNTPWTNEGIYSTGLTGNTEIIGSVDFGTNNKDIELDLTNYINNRIDELLLTGNTGSTNTSYGIGIKFNDNLELLDTNNRQAVAFHTHKTYTFFEPFIETIINSEIIDDRYTFYQDKDNSLYLSLNPNLSTNVNYVEIYDNNDELIDIISGDSVIMVEKGKHKINYNVNSDDYPDEILFTDKWYVNINGRSKVFEKDFFIVNWENFYIDNTINFDNYFFSLKGINDDELIEDKNKRKINITLKKLYQDQNENKILNLEYKLYVKETGDKIIEVIPYTKVNYLDNQYYIDLDLDWLIPQEYFIELRLNNLNSNHIYDVKRFKILKKK